MDDPLMVRWRRALGEASQARARFEAAEEELRCARIMLSHKEAELATATTSLSAAAESGA